jgi:hypothetical protein
MEGIIRVFKNSFKRDKIISENLRFVPLRRILWATIYFI